MNAEWIRDELKKSIGKSLREIRGIKSRGHEKRRRIQP